MYDIVHFVIQGDIQVVKLKLKLILALMVLGYDHSVVDKMGKCLLALPQPDLNDTEHVRC
jgi:hypothetical protein